MIDIDQLAEFHRQATIDWHNRFGQAQSVSPWEAIEDNHRQNFMLWHEEDIARRDDLPAERIKEAKRAIDQFNQNRNNAMERIDDWILNQTAELQPNARNYHSETPGMMVDRLSIMALKAFHMQEQADRTDASLEHRDKCASRVVVLEEQLGDLLFALKTFLKELNAGSRGFKVYRQFKMYNDPSTNPELYSNKVN